MNKAFGKDFNYGALSKGASSMVIPMCVTMVYGIKNPWMNYDLYYGPLYNSLIAISICLLFGSVVSFLFNLWDEVNKSRKRYSVKAVFQVLLAYLIGVTILLCSYRVLINNSFIELCFEEIGLCMLYGLFFEIAYEIRRAKRDGA
jgi:hypothetical protein